MKTHLKGYLPYLQDPLDKHSYIVDSWQEEQIRQEVACQNETVSTLLLCSQFQRPIPPRRALFGPKFDTIQAYSFDLEVCFYCFYSESERAAPYNRITIDI